jgi:hypothetical protein
LIRHAHTWRDSIYDLRRTLPRRLPKLHSVGGAVAFTEQKTMNQKVSVPVLIVIIVVAIAAIIGSVKYYRASTGADEVDQMHAAMSKTTPGKPPFSPEQMARMRGTGTGNPKGPSGPPAAAPQ